MNSGTAPPMTYTLRVAGHLDPRWVDWFDGFTPTPHEDGTTTLVGVVADQAQLHGLIAKVRDLGVTLISVDGVETSSPHDRGGGRPIRPE